MKAPHNHLFVRVESERNDEVVTKSGLKIFVPTVDYFKEDGDTSKPTFIKRHYGVVVGEPAQLTEDLKVTPVNPGFPSPSRYIPNEDIIIMKHRGIDVDSWSSLNLFVHQWKTASDFNQEISSSDKVYFHFNTVDESNLVQYLNDRIYKLSYTNAICVVRDGVIIPVAGHVLIEPVWDDGVEDIGDGKRGKVNSIGLVTELHDKPQYLKGKVTHVCEPMKGEEIGFGVGDTIVYAPHADWEVEIEGKKFYVMRYWDVEAMVEI
jgi:co-chaperonin GroES (HSP10)